MNTPTPFAQLGYTDKRASSLMSTGNEWGDMALDMAAGSNPVTGVPYYGAKALLDGGAAVGNAFKGDFGGAWKNLKSLGGNLLWGGASFLPGAIAGKAVGKGAVMAAKNSGRIAKGFQALKKPVARMAGNLKNTISTAANGTGRMAGAARGVQQYGKTIQQGQQYVNKQLNPMLDAAGNQIGKLTMPFGKGPIGQQAGRQVAGTAGMMAATAPASGLTGAAQGAAAPVANAAASAIPAAAPNAPSWYSAVTGSANVPKFK